MSTLDRLCASGLQPNPDSRGNEEMDMQDFRCVAMRLASSICMRVMIFLGADLGDSSNGDISVASWMHNTHVHRRGWEIPPWILGTRIWKTNKPESDSSNAYSYG